MFLQIHLKKYDLNVKDLDFSCVQCHIKKYTFDILCTFASSSNIEQTRIEWGNQFDTVENLLISETCE